MRDQGKEKRINVKQLETTKIGKGLVGRDISRRIPNIWRKW